MVLFLPLEMIRVFCRKRVVFQEKSAFLERKKDYFFKLTLFTFIKRYFGKIQIGEYPSVLKCFIKSPRFSPKGVTLEVQMSAFFKEKVVFFSPKSVDKGCFLKSHTADGVTFVYGVRGPGLTYRVTYAFSATVIRLQGSLYEAGPQCSWLSAKSHQLPGVSFGILPMETPADVIPPSVSQ